MKTIKILAAIALFSVCSFAQQKINGSRTLVGTSSLNEYIANEGVNGTTLNKLAKYTGAPTTLIIAATTDTGGIKGIVVADAGITGSAAIAVAGEAGCVFDGGTTANDYVQISSTTAGDCHDAGATAPLTGQIIGRVLSTNASGGTYAVSITHGVFSQSPSVVATIANAGTTGTTVNTLTKLTGAPSTAVIAATTDTGSIVGVTTAGAGTSGNAVIVQSGTTVCQFDGATTAGDYVKISATTAGNCADTGAATYPTSGQVIGRVLSTNGSSGAYTIDLFPSEIQASAGGGSSALSGITAATTSHTIANGNNPQTWQWSQTSNTQAGMTFNELAAATGGTITSSLNNQNLIAITTLAGSTATPLAITQGSNTGSTVVPVLTIQSTWNNASTVFSGIYANFTSTASNSGSLPLDIQVNAADILKLDRLGTFTIATGVAINIGNTQITSSNYGANIYTQNVTFISGKDTSSTSNQSGGTGNFRCADNTGATGTITGGTCTLRGGDVSSSTAAAVAGGVIIRPGRELGSVATTGPSNGKLQIVQIFIKGAANTTGALQCYSADDTVTDCSTASTNGLGVATATNTNAVDVQTEGIVTVNFASASPSAGWYVCSTTLSSGVNLLVQSGTCTAGQQVGVVTKGGSSITSTTAVLRFK